MRLMLFSYKSAMSYSPIIIYIYKEECLRLCVCFNAFVQFSRYRAETLQVGRGRPGTGRGGVKNYGDASGGGGLGCVKARTTQLVVYNIIYIRVRCLEVDNGRTHIIIICILYIDSIPSGRLR